MTKFPLVISLLLGMAAAQTTPAPVPQTPPPAQVTAPATPATPAQPTVAPATPATPANPAGVPGLPADWNAPVLSTASYLIQEPLWEGSTSLVTEEQRTAIVSALKRDSAGAIRRRYPAAKVVETAAPGVVKVTPVLVAPSALVPWAKLGVRLDMELPSGNRVSLSESFTVMTLWQKGPMAANFAYDQLAKRLP